MMGKMTKVLCMVAVGSMVFGWNTCIPWQKVLQDAAIYTGLEFVLDNDAVFDLFQDDFGTGAAYDDRFTAPTRAEPDGFNANDLGTGPV